MLSYKFIIDAKRNNSLRVRLRNIRKKAEFSLGLFMTEDELDEALSDRCRPQFATRRKFLLMCQSKLEALKLNLIESGQVDADISLIRTLAEKSLLGKEEITAEDESTTKIPDLFIDFFDHFIDSKANRSYKETLQHTRSRMVLYDKQLNERTLPDINIKWLNDFDDFLIKQGSSQNTRAIHFRNIRTVINRAIDEELLDTYPFRRFKIKTEVTKKRSLTVEQLRKLFSFPTDPVDIYYVEIFKLIFMFIGINLVDLHGLSEISPDGRIEYRRAKTHKLYSIKVEPEALEIINKYRGKEHLLEFADRWSDHRYFRRQMNEILQNLGVEKNKGGRLVGGAPKKTDKNKPKKSLFPGLTSYWARHTWATIAADLDIPDAVISLALGHSAQNRVTDIYIRRNQKKVDEANRAVLDYVLYGKKPDA